MCGITAYLGKDKHAHKMVHEGISILQNRGYDSAGIATVAVTTENDVNKVADVNNKVAEIICHKWAGSLSLCKLAETADKHQNSAVGIGHTRWATHGGVTDANAHPHLDYKNRVAVVHNGIIENYGDLKYFLQEENKITFRSETDTEVISNLIGHYLDKKLSVEEAISMTLEKLEGTWGLAIIAKSEPYRLYLAKKGSPLLLGWQQDFALAASQACAMVNHCKQYVVLEDGAFVRIDLGKSGIKIHKNGELQELEKLKVIKMIGEEKIQLAPGENWKHWMLKEIMEQPESLLRTINMGGRIRNEYEVRLGGLESKENDLLEIENLILMGCGTSLNAAKYGIYFFKQLQLFKSIETIDASEFTLFDLPNVDHKKIGILVLSQSGETKDVHRAMELVKELGIKIFSIVNVPGTLIAREAMAGVYLNAGREVGVASTKSFTSQVLALSLIAIWFSQKSGKHKENRAEIIKCIHSLSIDVERLLMELKETPMIDMICKELLVATNRSSFLLGRGMAKSIADEGALKMKEIGYLHAEGYAGGALKHGPFALITAGTPIFIIAPNDANYSKMLIVADEVKSRGARVYFITDSQSKDLDEKYDYVLRVPGGNKYFSSLYMVIPFQLISYHLALLQGHNPDQPKNLAKVVTVL